MGAIVKQRNMRLYVSKRVCERSVRTQEKNALRMKGFNDNGRFTSSLNIYKQNSIRLASVSVRSGSKGPFDFDFSVAYG